jgi:hypothetical protein
MVDVSRAVGNATPILYNQIAPARKTMHAQGQLIVAAQAWVPALPTDHVIIAPFLLTVEHPATQGASNSLAPITIACAKR